MSSTKTAVDKREHELTHENDDPDCQFCEFDWLEEAREIVEGRSLKMATRRHLEATFERIDELEGLLAVTIVKAEGRE